MESWVDDPGPDGELGTGDDPGWTTASTEDLDLLLEDRARWRAWARALEGSVEWARE